MSTKTQDRLSVFELAAKWAYDDLATLRRVVEMSAAQEARRKKNQKDRAKSQIMASKINSITDEDTSLLNPLIEAVRKNKKKRTISLLESGTDPNAAKAKYSQTALMLACKIEDTKISRLLIQYGADVNAEDRERWTALTHAATNGHVSQMRILLKHGASIDHRDSDGYTPLMSAVRAKKPSAAKYLIKKGANIDVVDIHGETSLMKALTNRDTEMVSMLLEMGTDATIPTSKGMTPLDIAKEYYSHTRLPEIIEKYLLSALKKTKRTKRESSISPGL